LAERQSAADAEERALDVVPNASPFNIQLRSPPPPSRAACGRGNDLDGLHHALVLVLHDVTVEDEPTHDRGVGKGNHDSDRAWLAILRRGQRERVVEAVHALRYTVDLRDEKLGLVD